MSRKEEEIGAKEQVGNSEVAGSPFVCEEEGGGVGDRHVPGILPNLYYHTLSYEVLSWNNYRVRHRVNSSV